MAYEQILMETDGGVATLTLNRPERMNAWTDVMAAELSDALAECERDDDVRAIVIAGAGRAFCAGADMSRGEGTFSGRERRERRSDPEARTLPFQIGKPVIAAINGHAVGVGITWPMLCDVRFVAEDAKIAFAFVRRGVMPELASHVTVARVAGLSNAADLLLSGRTVRGEEAARMGLASRALPAEEVLPTARALASDIATHAAPVSVAISKRLLWEGLTKDVPAMIKRETPLFAWCGNQPDAREGVTAFVEKRAPAFSLSATRDLPTELLDSSVS